jgi:hypothetical protein
MFMEEQRVGLRSSAGREAAGGPLKLARLSFVCVDGCVMGCTMIARAASGHVQCST